MKKETYYFTHDYSARSDEKIKKLISRHGLLGYGIYWCLIEDLYQNTNVLRLDYESICYDLRCDIDTIKSIINNFDLFIVNTETFSSSSVERRLNERREKSENARKSILSRWERKKENTNVLQTNNDSNTIKKRKRKESKEDIILSDLEISFDLFWNLYDKKVGDKEKLLKKWKKLTIKDRELIMNYIPKYKKAQPDKKFRKDPSTFLNNKSWNDEIIGGFDLNSITTLEQLHEYNKENGIDFSIPTHPDLYPEVYKLMKKLQIKKITNG